MNGPQLLAIGRLTRDPKLQYSTNRGIPYVTVGLAVHTSLGPNQDPETTFYETTFWTRLAHVVANHCRRGQPILVQGEYRFRTFTRQNGSEGYSHELTANDVTLLQTQSPPQQQPQQQPQAAQTQPAAQQPDADPAPENQAQDQYQEEEDLPY